MCRPIFLVALVAILGHSQAFNLGGFIDNVETQVNNALDTKNDAVKDALDAVTDSIKHVVEEVADGANQVADHITCPAPTMARAFHALLVKKVKAVFDASTPQCQEIMEKKFKYAQATCLPALLMAVRGEDEDDEEEAEQAAVAAGGEIDEERYELLMAGVRMFTAVCKQPFMVLRDNLTTAGCTKGVDLVNFILFLPHKITGYYFHKRMALEEGYAAMNEKLTLAKDEMTPGHPCRTWMDANNATFVNNCPTLGEGWSKHIEFADKMRSLQDQCFGGGDLPPL